MIRNENRPDGWASASTAGRSAAWQHDSLVDRTGEIEIDVYAETAIVADDDVVHRRLSDASMLAAAPILHDVKIPLSPALPVEIEEDAYFHPGGAIRALGTPAEGLTVQFQRVHAKAKRSWVFAMTIAVALPIVLVAIIIMIGRALNLGDSAQTNIRQAHAADVSRSPLARTSTPRAATKTTTARPSSLSGWNRRRPPSSR